MLAKEISCPRCFKVYKSRKNINLGFNSLFYSRFSCDRCDYKGFYYFSFKFEKYQFIEVYTSSSILAKRKFLYERDLCRCHYCHKHIHFDESSIDHIHPVSEGGLNTLDNLVTSCMKCNGDKQSLPYDEFIKRFVYHQPKKKPRYNWFRWKFWKFKCMDWVNRIIFDYGFPNTVCPMILLKVCLSLS